MNTIEKTANDYAERVCNGQFPIEYTREQVVKHTAGDFEAGAKWFQKEVIRILTENYVATKDGFAEEDKYRTALEMVNELSEDYIAIFSSAEWQSQQEQPATKKQWQDDEFAAIYKKMKADADELEILRKKVKELEHRENAALKLAASNARELMKEQPIVKHFGTGKYHEDEPVERKISLIQDCISSVEETGRLKEQPTPTDSEIEQQYPYTTEQLRAVIKLQRAEIEQLENKPTLTDEQIEQKSDVRNKCKTALRVIVNAYMEDKTDTEKVQHLKDIAANALKEIENSKEQKQF